MGNLHYDGHTFAFEDRTLVHLQVAIGAKLRRNESFFPSWKRPTSEGSGHLSMWMQPSIPLLFEFVGNRDPHINPAWIQQLTESSNSGGGLHLLPEPTDTSEPTPAKKQMSRT
jgi:hypothetical protein